MLFFGTRVVSLVAVFGATGAHEGFGRHPQEQRSKALDVVEEDVIWTRFLVDEISSMAQDSPSAVPSAQPTKFPTKAPIRASVDPSPFPTSQPSDRPSKAPVATQPNDTEGPTIAPSRTPTSPPSAEPTKAPAQPLPTISPSVAPSTEFPSSAPSPMSLQSSNEPSSVPSLETTAPTVSPSGIPSPMPSAQPSFSPDRLNQILTCISVIDESRTAGVDGPPRDFTERWAELRMEFPERPFCLLQPQRDNGSPDRASLGIPAAFDSELNKSTRYRNVTRDTSDELDPSDWYSICGLGELLKRKITKVAFFIDDSTSLRGISAVQNSFNLFQDTLSENGFEVVTGAINNQEDWVTPCRSARVVDGQSSIACTANTQCDSFVCVDGFCRNNLQGIGQPCDDKLDCQNLACGLPFSSSIGNDTARICCPSHAVASGFCADQPVGAPCANDNDVCSSNVCISGVCQDRQSDIGETCDRNDLGDCANGVCGHATFIQSAPFICCPSNSTFSAGGDRWCRGQPAGETCVTANGGSEDRVCASDVCIEGVCQPAPVGIGETCDRNDRGDCANGACGHATFDQSAPFICCPSNSTFAAGGERWCRGQPAGETCVTASGGSQDRVCASDVCIEGVCQPAPVGIGETCDRNDRGDCANDACGHATFRQSAPFICCPSNSFFWSGGDTWCRGQPAGETCVTASGGSEDRVCDSGTCVDGICA